MKEHSIDDFPANVPFTENISYKQARNAVLIAIVLGILFSAAQIGIDLRNEKRLVSETIRQILSTVGETAAEASFNLDKELGQKTANGLFAYGPIIEVSIQDDLGTVIAYAKRPKATTENHYLSDSLFGDITTFSSSLILSGKRAISVGKISVLVDTYLIANEFMNQALAVLLLGLLRALVLALILAGLFYLTLTRPLVRSLNVMDATQQRGDHRVHQAPIPEGHERDEIGYLIRTINSLTVDIFKSEAQYKEASSIAKLGHWIYDEVADNILFCSDELARIHGVTPDAYVAMVSSIEKDVERVHPDDREKYGKALRDGRRDAIPYKVEYRIIKPNGEIRHIREIGEPVCDSTGKMVQSRGTLQDVTEIKLAEEALSYQATHDVLTGLINRSEFERRIERVLHTARASQGEHALCYLDLDQFKVVNDTCGHMAGDELLRQIGLALSETVRKRDTLARLGGDEFGVLMEHCTLEQAKRVAENLRRAVADFRFVWEGQMFRVGMSAGLVAIAEASESTTALLSAADSACYVAKDEGRNRVHVYRLDDSDLAQRHGEMQWVTRINQALEEDRFELWSQPIAPVARGTDEGEHFEVLLRLIDEDGGTVPPGAFLPAAERYGLSTELDRWVIDKALGWLHGNPKRLEGLHLCCINLSGPSLAEEEFLEFMMEQLAQSRVPAEKLCFEVTETAAIANLSRAITFMGALKEQGCKFALDDFGSGLSSFAYLKTLPVDYLKIDGAFVKDIVDDAVDLAMVRSINDVGTVMGKATIAEFVENDEILKILSDIGIDYAQGYGIGRPAPTEETK